jgi:phosphoglycerol transferase MdoB-like AlkP superfamily enzyme
MLDKRESSNNWQAWAKLILGIWLFVSPWVVRYTDHVKLSWDAWAVGVVLVVVSIATLMRLEIWEDWFDLVLGAWVFISPWALGVPNPSSLTSHSDWK